MAKPRKNIYLIGPRASGKTTLGRLLAEDLERPFVDTDQLFVERREESISALVEREGWDRFREIESEILADVAGQEGLVVATGGGIVLAQANRERLVKGYVVYLQADPETLIARLAADLEPDKRPALTEMNFADEVRRTLAERDPVYMSLAHILLPDAPVEELAAKAVRAVTMLEGEAPMGIPG